MDGKIALVTGATRGIGKGIALKLAEAGATVYITGRTLRSTKNNSGSLEETANEIEKRGGKCIPVQVDHENDAQIAALFEKIKQEQDGRLDILVNNAYKSAEKFVDNRNLKFWEIEPEFWDDVNNVGLRNHYICTVYAARLMVPHKNGLIINITSIGGIMYTWNVAYGVGKAALNRMAADCGIELKKHNVACLSLSVGAVKTELINNITLKLDDNETYLKDASGQEFSGGQMRKLFSSGASVEFIGKCVVRLASDRNIMEKTSKVIFAEDYAQSNNIKDIDGRVIPSLRQVNVVLENFLPDKLKFLSSFVPNFIKIPLFVFDIMNSKF